MSLLYIRDNFNIDIPCVLTGPKHRRDACDSDILISPRTTIYSFGLQAAIELFIQHSYGQKVSYICVLGWRMTLIYTTMSYFFQNSKELHLKDYTSLRLWSFLTQSQYAQFPYITKHRLLFADWYFLTSSPMTVSPIMAVLFMLLCILTGNGQAFSPSR